MTKNVQKQGLLRGMSPKSDRVAERSPRIMDLLAAANSTSMSGAALAYDVAPIPSNVGDRSPAHEAEVGAELRPLGGKAKRLVDLIVASATVVLTSALMLLLVILVKGTSKGPAIFAHRRIGFGGKPFNCYKFRTMVLDAERVLNAHLSNNPEAAREWRECRKLKRDPRITPIGRILRVSSLDELPQLFNVLRGEMSCVGPRPIVVDELREYRSSFAEYLQTRPGLTGPWQVSGRNLAGYSQRVELDRNYVRNWRLSLDAMILFRTTFALLRFDRAS